MFVLIDKKYKDWYEYAKELHNVLGDQFDLIFTGPYPLIQVIESFKIHREVQRTSYLNKKFKSFIERILNYWCDDYSSLISLYLEFPENYTEKLIKSNELNNEQLLILYKFISQVQKALKNHQIETFQEERIKVLHSYSNYYVNNKVYLSETKINLKKLLKRIRLKLNYKKQEKIKNYPFLFCYLIKIKILKLAFLKPKGQKNPPFIFYDLQDLIIKLIKGNFYEKKNVSNYFIRKRLVSSED